MIARQIQTKDEAVASIKELLAERNNPAQLMAHPWAESLLVADFKLRAGRSNNTDLLVLEAFAELFKNMLPSTKPRRGKRLDTSWGQFGMLAAMYFAEIEFDFPSAGSLRDAWGKIDNVISMYIRQKFGEEFPKSEEEKYYLLSDEKEVTPTSTLSDWHARGLERFAELVYTKERRLSSASGVPSPVFAVAIPSGGSRQKLYKPDKRFTSRVSLVRRYLGRFIFGAMLTLLLYLGWIGLSSYLLARQLYAQGSELKAVLVASMDLEHAEELAQAADGLQQFRQTAEALRARAGPLTWVASRLGWLPFIGKDLVLVDPLLSALELTAIAAEQLHQGISPILNALGDVSGSASIGDLTGLLQASAPQFQAAAAAASQAAELRAKVDLRDVHPALSELILTDFDPAFIILEDSAQLMAILPTLLGMEGQPANYLLLLQNEDELRATGGFITAVGGLVLQNGEILSFKLENSYDVDDYNYVYPAPPWQLEEYMDAPILVLRDANWRPDFPIVAQQTETLYAYSRAHTVDGVIAVDQHTLELLVRALGSVRVGGKLITSENVLSYMQAERGAVPDPGESTTENNQWLRNHRKDFMRPIAEAILAQLRSGSGVPWHSIVQALGQALDEKHILFQFDDPTVAGFLSTHGWDGQLRYTGGDYLMLVDANIGFTKSNPIITTDSIYNIDLTDLSHPASALSITYQNDSIVNRECTPGPSGRGVDLGDYEGLINQCHWTYLRVYKPEATRVSDYRAQSIPSEWMLSGQSVPARIDYLNELDDFAEFGTMIVIPTQGSQTIAMAFELPEGVIEQVGDNFIYRLTIQKQPGVKELDLTIGVTLPPGALLIASNQSEWIQEGKEVGGRLQLVRDTIIEIVFFFP